MSIDPVTIVEIKRACHNLLSGICGQGVDGGGPQTTIDDYVHYLLKQFNTSTMARYGYYDLGLSALADDVGFRTLIVQFIADAMADFAVKIDVVERDEVKDAGAATQVVRVERRISIADILGDALRSDYHTEIVSCTAKPKGGQKGGQKGAQKKSDDSAAGAAAAAAVVETACPGGIDYHDPHAKTHRVSCSYHSNDPLYVHLVLAAICSTFWARKNGVSGRDGRDLYLVFVTALLHDIGKPSCMRLEEYPNRAIISYYAHGEIGGDILRALLGPAFDDAERHLISTIVTQHMCGYHGPNDDIAQKKRALLRHVKLYPDLRMIPFLTALAFGDGTGKLAAEQHVAEGKSAEFLRNIADFEQEMKAAFSFPNYLRAVGMPNKIVVMPIAASGAGKSYWTSEFSAQLDAAGIGYSIVSRDTTIIECAVGIPTRLTGKLYALAHRFYSISKRAPSSKLRGKQRDHIMAQIDADYAALVEEWNAAIVGTDYADKKIEPGSAAASFRDIRNDVRELFNDRIDAALAGPDRIIIIDTFMTSFPDAMKPSDARRPGMTPNLGKYFVVHVRINSLVPIAGQNGLTEDEQLNVSCAYSVRHPGPPGGLRNLRGITSSAYSNSSYDPKSSSRPDLVVGCARLPGAAAGAAGAATAVGPTYGYDETMRLLIDMASQLLSTPAIALGDGASGGAAAAAAAAGGDLVGSPIGSPIWTDSMYKDCGIREMCERTIGPSGAFSIPDFIENLRWMGFKVTHPLHKKEMTDDYARQMSKLTASWARAGIIERAYSIDELKSDARLCESIARSLFLVKYVDGLNGPRFWQNKWARESRGTVLFRHPITHEITVLSYKLQRGAEVLTGKQKKDGVDETENYNEKSADFFDNDQKKVIHALMNEKALKTFATSKCDGMLVVFTTYTGFAKIVMEAVIDAFGSNLAKLMAEQSAIVSDGSHLVVASTQGTVFMKTESGVTHIEPYVTTAALAGTGLVPIDELREYAATKDGTCTAAWERWGQPFIEQIIGVSRAIDATITASIPPTAATNDATSFMFEAVCPDRRDVWLGHDHTELAASYDRAIMCFLGASICNVTEYIPHVLVRNMVGAAWPSSFYEPLWWDIDDPDGECTVDDLLSAFNDVTDGKMQKADLIKRFPPANRDLTPDEAIDRPLDVEGLVLMTPVGEGIVPGIPRCDYAKAKTIIYYRTHKFRPKYIAYYIELDKIPYAKARFPLIGRVADFFRPGAVTTALMTICNGAIALLDGTATIGDAGDAGDATDADDAQAMGGAAAAAAAAAAAPRPTYRAKYIKAFPDKARKGFDGRPPVVQMAMLVNIAKEFGHDLIPIAIQQFPSMGEPITPDEKTDVASTMKSLIMALRPWDDDGDDLKTRIGKLDHESVVMQKMAGLVLGFKL